MPAGAPPSSGVEIAALDARVPAFAVAEPDGRAERRRLGDAPLESGELNGRRRAGPAGGTFNSCGIHNRLDYIFISRNLDTSFRSGGVFRKGLWGSRKTRPDRWTTYAEMTCSAEQASDHAAVFIDLDL